MSTRPPPRQFARAGFLHDSRNTPVCFHQRSGSDSCGRELSENRRDRTTLSGIRTGSRWSVRRCGKHCTADADRDPVLACPLPARVIFHRRAWHAGEWSLVGDQYNNSVSRKRGCVLVLAGTMEVGPNMNIRKRLPTQE